MAITLTWLWLMSAAIAVSCATVHDADCHGVPKKSNVCTGGGYVYDPDDCQVFYKCIYSNKLGSYIPVKTICSPGTVFSKNRHNTCVSPKKSGRPECERSRPSSIYSLRVKGEDSPEGADAPVASKSDLIVCKKQGFLEDPEDCTKFYLCVVSGINTFKKYDYFCPPSTVWESRRRWCVVSWATSREECKTNDAPPGTDESGSSAEMPFLPPPIFDDEDAPVDKPGVPEPEAGGQVTPVPEPGKPSDDQSSAASEHVPAQHPSLLPTEQGNESSVEHPTEHVPEVESVNGQTEVPERENESENHDPKAPEHGNEATSEQTVVPEHDNAPGDPQPEVPEHGNESGESHVATSAPQSESGESHVATSAPQSESGESHVATSAPQSESGDAQPGQSNESGEKQPEVTEPGSVSGEHEPVTPVEGSESGGQQHPDEAPVQKDESDDHHPAAPGHESGGHHPDEVSTPTGDLGDQNPAAPGHENESEQHHPDEAPVHKDESGGEHPEAPGHENDSGDHHSGVPEHVPESGHQDAEVSEHNNAAGDQQPEVPEGENESGDQQPEVPEHGDGSHEHPSISVNENESADEHSQVPDHENVSGDQQPEVPERENESGDEHSQVPDHENVSGDQQPEVPERENESGDEQRPESPVHKDESGDQQSGAPEYPKVDSEDQEPGEHNPAVPEDGSESNEQTPVVVPEAGNESDEQASAVPPEHGNGSFDDEDVLGHPVSMKPPNKCPSGPTNTVSAHCPIGHLTGTQVALVCPTGFRRHPRFCNLFYQCTSSSEYDYKVAVLSCPGTTCYDNSKMQCLPANELSDPCGGVYAGTALYRTLARHSLSPVYVPGHRLCPGVGHYPYEDGCSNLFYKCVANADNTIDGYVYECPQGYMYRAAAGRCEEASRFDCSD